MIHFIRTIYMRYFNPPIELFYHQELRITMKNEINFMYQSLLELKRASIKKNNKSIK